MSKFDWPMTHEQKVDRLMYVIFGNGVPGAIERLEAVEMIVNEISIHHAQEPHIIAEAIEMAFEKRFGKKNSSILLTVAICGAITGIVSLILMVVK